MKKKLLRYEKKLISVRLHFDELEQIVSTMETLKGKLVLETREYELSSLDELSKVARGPLKRLKIFSLRNNNERITVEYTDEIIVISFQPEENNELRGVADKISEIIKRKYLYKFLEIILEIFIASIFLLVLQRALSLTPINKPDALVVIFGLIEAGWLLSTQGKYYCRIVPKHKKDEMSFLEKNSENLWLRFIGWLMVAGLTWVFLK